MKNDTTFVHGQWWFPRTLDNVEKGTSQRLIYVSNNKLPQTETVFAERKKNG